MRPAWLTRTAASVALILLTLASSAGPARAASTFTDVSPTTGFAHEIGWLADGGITTGYPDGTFRPLEAVNRDAMAAYLFRLSGRPAFTPPATSPFVDVAPGDPFYREITWLATTGIASGWPDGSFRPVMPVERGAMAAYLYRYAGRPAFTPPARSPFTDVATTHPFYQEIAWMASRQITTGWADGTFRPGTSIKRDSAAATLYRTEKRDRRGGTDLDRPWVADGVPVVSQWHRITARYVPAWSTRPWGLHPDAHAAYQRMASAARAAGAPISIRSAYRSFATQDQSFRNAVAAYGLDHARRYYAEAGASEHQTGLALDVWDGSTRGAAFASTPQGRWVAAHAHEYGFIIRYPQDKQHITGVWYESWHLRWVGVDISRRFGPHSTMTLEEYLHLA